ncbi:MAG: carbohydrate ABC transporter permease [bacterium]|jgi:multiple sugar transport system permease protein
MAKNQSTEIHSGKLALLFSAPALLILIVTVVVPIFYAIYLSFHRYKLKRAKRPFIGLQNYEKILTDSGFWESLATSLVFAVSVVGVIVAVSFFLALLLDQDFPGRGLLRALLLIPWAIPDVVNALLWKWLLHPAFGIMNALFQMGGLIDEYVAWLSSMPSALIWVIIAYSWKNIPLATLLILAGLQTISKSLHEAAMVEGATAWQRTLNITLPLLRPTLTVVLIFETIFALKVFDLIYVLTSGGPGKSTTVLGWSIYINTFKKLDFGTGSALAMILGLLTLFIAIVFYAFLDRGERQ